jgi:hypothetical protein
MRDLIKDALIRVAIATVVAACMSTLSSVGGEPGRSIMRTAAVANPLCAPRPIKMPCLQPDA